MNEQSELNTTDTYQFSLVHFVYVALYMPLLVCHWLRLLHCENSRLVKPFVYPMVIIEKLRLQILTINH